MVNVRASEKERGVKYARIITRVCGSDLVLTEEIGYKKLFSWTARNVTCRYRPVKDPVTKELLIRIAVRTRTVI